MFALVELIQDDGLTVREVLSDIPHDAAAIFVYLLLALFVGFAWWGGRSRPSPSERDEEAGDVRGDEQDPR